jgi:hypothetical protein
MGQHDRRILCFPSTLDYLDQTTIICRDRAQISEQLNSLPVEGTPLSNASMCPSERRV